VLLTNTTVLQHVRTDHILQNTDRRQWVAAHKFLNCISASNLSYVYFCVLADKPRNNFAEVIIRAFREAKNNREKGVSY
jgi:hypothetical protein